MTIVWLVVWLLNSQPTVSFSPSLNNWAVFLVVTAIVDLGATNL